MTELVDQIDLLSFNGNSNLYIMFVIQLKQEQNVGGDESIGP